MGETVHFAAELQMPEFYNVEDRKLREDIVLQLMGLTHVKDTVVGDALLRGVSGGEKRRVSIAIELVKGSVTHHIPRTMTQTSFMVSSLSFLDFSLKFLFRP